MKQKIDSRIAVLIDAENVPYANIGGVLREVARYGTPTVKRIYGDWTKQTASGWKSHLLEHAITPIQQYSYTTGKNSSDSAMIIDAMDILYEGNVESFCIVSSDSDFTRLAVRLREAGKYVIGIGEQKTPSAFIASCDKFIYIEIIDLVETERVDSKTKLSVDKKNKLHQLIASSVNDLADDNGFVFMGDLGNLIMKKQPDFDPRNYGYYQLTPLIKALGQFDIDERRIPNSNVKHVYIRNK
ncbi:MULTISPECIES: NYN domain-containing protein [Erysipelothrix]|uniref:NYN domain-containing protein n=2 Tax=Erysipelothrix piscisicarius TaxID=2485784 RepID=A0A3Q8S6P8_9FIRM|nr:MULTISPECIES: NYN domain-containing protein [Erysipelothrix]AZK43566.1 NYN domain-containing protein [Erysipelothrix piscisicarius]MBK2402710.1 NYN domain-containing protein [Erysipelothrix sp. strain 2 (EsS2-6-Brazil)]MBK2403559.1 NYN domain-containing protein [Erysipelothrix sp. strain 2 (EsS2-7-Brazil)]